MPQPELQNLLSVSGRERAKQSCISKCSLRAGVLGCRVPMSRTSQLTSASPLCGPRDLLRDCASPGFCMVGLGLQAAGWERGRACLEHTGGCKSFWHPPRRGRQCSACRRSVRRCFSGLCQTPGCLCPHAPRPPCCTPTSRSHLAAGAGVCCPAGQRRSLGWGHRAGAHLDARPGPFRAPTAPGAGALPGAGGAGRGGGGGGGARRGGQGGREEPARRLCLGCGMGRQ